MKYALMRNAKTLERIDNKLGKFTDEHWSNMMKLGHEGWELFPKLKVFISFSECDRKRMEIIVKVLNNSELLTSLVVESNRRSNESISNLVIESINESHYFIPILSEESIKTQWVNQEIGYAKSKVDLKLLPVTQSIIINTLKGFIHNQVQLPYMFDLTDRPKSDRIQFEKLCNVILNDLEALIEKNYTIVNYIK
ncbi:MAG: toll/interleukin-1 receptor domain-containing protein [Saprospiraceae bacterium]|nr:toll/interleukin-1 receptor domain-containing protein [Saprospiraceae bacterium]